MLSDNRSCQKLAYVRWLRCHSKAVTLRILAWTLVFQFFSIFAKKRSGCVLQWRIIGIMSAPGPPLPLPSYLPPYPPPPPLLVQIIYSTKCRFMQIIVFPGRICVITLAPSHPLLNCEQITNVNYQVSAKVNRLENKVSGKGKKGAQHLQPESIICEVTCSTGAKYTLYR